jgi:hypothetical protein
MPAGSLQVDTTFFNESAAVIVGWLVMTRASEHRDPKQPPMATHRETDYP